jgi:hypothetical protein
VIIGFVLTALLASMPPVQAQGVVNDLLAGRLLDPKVGQWAWYTLHSADDEQRLAVRQAIVAAEPVGRRTGYWLEVEIVPEAGYKTVFKMLLTGPASDPRNVHRIIAKYGLDPAYEVPVEQHLTADEAPRARRRSQGMEDLLTHSGVIRAERFTVTQGEQELDLWLHDAVLPTGIVRLRSSEGEMILSRYGTGGRDAESLIDADEIVQPAPEPGEEPEE